MRLIGALAIDPVIYEEVEADRSATWQALLVVVLSSLSAGVGAFGWGTASLRGVLFVSGLALVSWAAWAVITFEIGTRLMPEPGTRADVGQLLRTIGFSAAPGILRIFGIVPGATVPAFVITAIWMLVAMVVAVRQALDYQSTARAVAVCGLGWALSIGIAVVLQWLFGPTVVS
jgi:hypothetical protein